MKKRTRIILISAIVVFVVLFGLRLTHELTSGSEFRSSPQGNIANMVANDMVQTSRGGEGSVSKSNYASSKIVISQQAATAQILDQKYERVASLGMRSKDFDDDTRKIRESVVQFKAVVQQENAYGLEGSRVLTLSIGVVPEAFEPSIEQLKKVGNLLSSTVTKTDKTADFKALEAKKVSLEKTRDGLKALRRPSADLNDLMQLETKILEIEGQLQDLGVSLGDFGENNSLCTIQISVSEKNPETRPLRILPSMLNALEWTAWVYCALILSLVLFLAFVLLTGILAQKIIEWKQALESKDSTR